MKNLTNFRKNVETGLDPRLPLLCHFMCIYLDFQSFTWLFSTFAFSLQLQCAFRF